MGDRWWADAKQPNPSSKPTVDNPVVDDFFESFSNKALGQLRLWLEDEETPPAAAASGSYLQAQGGLFGGAQFQVLTLLNSYSGGNGTDTRGGTWTWAADATSPFNGIRLQTSVDGDWWAFPVGNLGPQGAGYGVAVWYYRDVDTPKFEIEWATVPVDEFGNTPSGPIGSSTSIIDPFDIDLYGATNFAWYNTANASDIAHSYKWDSYKASSPIWDCVIGRSPFVLGGTDGTMLTANATNNSDWDSAKTFNGGGGPDVAWWMRVLVNGKTGSAYNAKLGQVWVYRLNGAGNVVGGG